MHTLVVSFEQSGDLDMHRRHAERWGDLRPWLEQVGNLLLSSMLGRLTERLKMGDDVIRTGRLTASLDPNVPGTDQIRDLSAATVEVGSNVPYAAQVNFGGPIRPKTGRALAIPLTDALKRSGRWPRQFGPDELVFVESKKPGVIGLLYEKTGTGRLKKRAAFLLTGGVQQKGKHFAVIDEDDKRNIFKLLDEHLSTEG